MSYYCSHEENRKKICIGCGRKIFPGKKTIASYKISEKCTTLIKKYLNRKFHINDSKFSTSICNSCRNTLFEHDEKNIKRPLPIPLK